MSRYCEICKKIVEYGQGVKIVTDRLEHRGHASFHLNCFDSMWSQYMKLDESEEIDYE